MSKKQLSVEYAIPLLCTIAILCPLRADGLRNHSIRLEYFWTQLHKLNCGISWSNVEILFPLGAFALILIALNFTFISLKFHRPSLLILSICFLLQLIFRSFVDFYLITTYFPLNIINLSNFDNYWLYPGSVWRLLAFTGGCASVTVFIFQMFLITKRVKNIIQEHHKTTGENLSEATK